MATKVKLTQDEEALLNHFNQDVGEQDESGVTKIIAAKKLTDMFLPLFSNSSADLGKIDVEYLSQVLSVELVKGAKVIKGEIHNPPNESLEKLYSRFNLLVELINKAEPIVKALLIAHNENLKGAAEGQISSVSVESQTDKKVADFASKLLKDRYDKTEAGLVLNGTSRHTIRDWIKKGYVNYEMSGKREIITKEEVIRLYRTRILKS